MVDKTQQERVVNHLKEHHSVSHNWALGNYMSRLAAIISDLKKDGWKFETKLVETPHGKDYVYVVIESPLPKNGVLFSC